MRAIQAGRPAVKARAAEEVWWKSRGAFPHSGVDRGRQV